MRHTFDERWNLKMLKLPTSPELPLQKKFVSATFDLQSVLQIPSSAVSQMYYSRKICVYNLCIYEAATPNNGFCYCWSELEGRRGSNEIGTCVFRWLTQLPYETKEVSLYSDTSEGQNRNRNVAAMFLYAVQQLPIKAITHNFLESGHSHMECDSMHAAIEAEKKYKDVYTMLDWISIFRGARRRHPYKVNNLHYEDMLDFHCVATMLFRNRLRDEDGNIINWLLVKCFKYLKDEPGTIIFVIPTPKSLNELMSLGAGDRHLFQQKYQTRTKLGHPLALQKRKTFFSSARRMLYLVKCIHGSRHFQALEMQKTAFLNQE